MATMARNNSYYTPLVKSSNDDNVYDALDVIYENRQKIFKRINTNITKNIGRLALSHSALLALRLHRQTLFLEFQND